MAGKDCLVLFMIVILFVNSETVHYAGSFSQPASIGINNKGPCSVYIRTELPEREPVFISNDYRLMIPRKGYLSWETEATSWIACPSSEYDEAEKIKCIKGFLFQSDREGIFDIRNTTCRHMITGNEKLMTNPQCTGTSRAIGFNVTFPDKSQRFIDLYHSCINETNGSVLYTRHTLFGTEINHKCSVPKINVPSFKADGFTAKLDPRLAYSGANTVLSLIFYLYPFEQSFDRGNHLQKSLLTPHEDQLFTTWQFSTYYYINVAGMWNRIITGNWKKVEDAVRSFASTKSRTLDIFTGTYGVLRIFPDYRELFLAFTSVKDEEFIEYIPVPKWVWKIVKDPTADAAIALVVSNNPFVNATRLCQSNEPYGWHHEDYDNYQNGQVSICTVQQLQKIVDYIPKEAVASKVLKHD